MLKKCLLLALLSLLLSCSKEERIGDFELSLNIISLGAGSQWILIKSEKGKYTFTLIPVEYKFERTYNYFTPQFKTIPFELFIEYYNKINYCLDTISKYYDDTDRTDHVGIYDGTSYLINFHRFDRDTIKIKYDLDIHIPLKDSLIFHTLDLATKLIHEDPFYSLSMRYKEEVLRGNRIAGFSNFMKIADDPVIFNCFLYDIDQAYQKFKDTLRKIGKNSNFILIANNFIVSDSLKNFVSEFPNAFYVIDREFSRDKPENPKYLEGNISRMDSVKLIKNGVNKDKIYRNLALAVRDINGNMLKNKYHKEGIPIPVPDATPHRIRK